MEKPSGLRKKIVDTIKTAVKTIAKEIVSIIFKVGFLHG